jgi:hypothetical protein
MGDIKVDAQVFEDILTELKYIKENMVEKEDMMTCEEFESYKKSFDKENLVSLDDAEKELDL